MSVLADDAVRHYLGLPYRIVLARDDEAEAHRSWRASVDELPGCEARGSTAAEAAARIPAALAEWVATAQAEGREIPEPGASRAFSGKLLLRMPQSLHGELAEAAERDQVSLNAYINGLLAAAVHWRQPPRTAGRDEAEGSAPVADDRAIGLQRFVARALAANVAIVALAAVVALIMLL